MQPVFWMVSHKEDMLTCKEPVPFDLANLDPLAAMPHEHDSTQSTLRALLYLGVFMLLGAGIFARYVGPEAARAQRWRLWYLLSGGFLLALGATFYTAYHVAWMLGDTSLVGSYLLETRQGNLLLARLALLAGLLGLSMGWFRLDRWVYPPLALGLLLTLTFTSHAGAVGGLQPWADLLHLGFGVVWAGCVLALAVVWPKTRYEAALPAVQRLSALGLASVIGVALLGGYLSWMRLGQLSNLWDTAYGQRLLLKLGLVVLVVGLAALNRFWLLPRFQVRRAGGLPSVGLEALLIAGVLITSGLLATTEPPPPPGQAAPSLISLSEAVGNQRYVGQLFSQAGLIHLYLDLRDAEGNLLEGGPPLRVRAQRGTEVREDTLVPFHKSQYHSALVAEQPGEWKVWLELPGKALEFTLNVKR